MNFENPTLNKKNNQETEGNLDKTLDKVGISSTEEIGEKDKSISGFEKLDPNNLKEEQANEISEKVQTKEYIEDEDLLKLADQVESKLDRETIQKQINDAEKYKGKKGIFLKLQKNKFFKSAAKVVLVYMLLFKVNAAFADNNTEQDQVKDMKGVEMVADNLDGDGNINLDDNTFVAHVTQDIGSENNLNNDNSSDDEEDNIPSQEKISNNESNNEYSSLSETKASVLDIDKYFENNEANIDETGKAEILNHTLNFFNDMAGEDSNMDKDKLRDFLNNEIKIQASANELSREGGNEGLSIERGEVLKSILNSPESLDKITDNLKNLGLNKIEVNQVLEKFSQAKVEIPHSETGHEAGVTYITDMENPNTNENYTSLEVEDMKSNNPEEYKRLLAEARSVKIDLSAEPSEEIEKMKIKGVDKIDIDNEIIIEKLSPRFFEMKNYQEILIGFDNSQSTHDDNEGMTNVIQQNFDDIKRSATDSKIENIKVASFDDDLGKVKNYDVEDSDEAFNHIYDQENKGDGWERAVDAASELVDKADSDKNSLCYIQTDERIQDVSVNEIEELQKKCTEKNVEIKFLVKPAKIISENNENLELESNYVEVGLEELAKAVSDKIQKNVDKTTEYFNNLRTTDTEAEVEEKKLERIETFKDIQGDIKEIKLSNGVTLKWY